MKDAASAGFYTSVKEKIKVPRVQLLSIEGLLDGNIRAEHTDDEPGLTHKKAKPEKLGGEQPELL